MKPVQEFIDRQPLLSALAVVIVSFSLMRTISLFGVSDPDAKEITGTLLRFMGSFLLLAFIYKMSWQKEALITTPYSDWGKRWILAMVPIAIIGSIGLLGADFDVLIFSVSNVLLWVTSNVAIGLWEEVMMRGVCFYIFYRAWGSTRKGLYVAIVVQALIFGLAHYLNIFTSGMSFGDATSQVTNATLIGIGFGGLMLYTRTIWVPVFLHFYLDLVGTMNEHLLPEGMLEGAQSLSVQVSAAIALTLFVAIPGLLFTKQAPLRVA